MNSLKSSSNKLRTSFPMVALHVLSSSKIRANPDVHLIISALKFTKDKGSNFYKELIEKTD
jgi:hypothetical protein